MTKEQFDTLQSEWEACEYHMSQDGSEAKRAVARQLEIERLMDAAPWEFDEDGNVVERPQQ